MSPKNSLNAQDFKKWLNNLLVFLAPLVVVYLTSVISSINSSGLNLQAFYLNTTTTGALALYILNATVDLFKKYSAGTN